MEIFGKNINDDNRWEIATCRGFLVNDTGIINESAAKGDPEYYRTFMKSKDRFKPLEPKHYGFSGTYDFLNGQNKWLNHDFKTWKACRYGVKVPVQYLDVEIGLIVKTLGCLGIITSYSCSGHGISRPQISFNSIQFSMQFGQKLS